MAKRKNPPRPFHSEARTSVRPPATRSAWRRIDVFELGTGVFVLVASLLPASPWFKHANGIVATTLVFEFGMAWLAMFAHGASFALTRAVRIALVCVGAVMVIVAGTYHAVQLERAALILPGVWIVAMRLRRPAGVGAFDALHCRCIAFEAMTAWLTLIGVFVVYVLVHALSGGTGPAQMRQDGRFAIVWGGFYAALALLMPVARQLAFKRRGPAQSS